MEESERSVTFDQGEDTRRLHGDELVESSAIFGPIQRFIQRHQKQVRKASNQ